MNEAPIQLRKAIHSDHLLRGNSVWARDDYGSISPFSGKVRRKPAILILSDDLVAAHEISLHADKQSLVCFIFWSLENLLMGVNPHCDVLVIEESIEKQLLSPMYMRLLKLLGELPCVVRRSESDIDGTPRLSPLNQVYKRLDPEVRALDVIAAAVEAYHDYQDRLLLEKTAIALS
jgi:hypothetical protein